jgi:hypothetical protein
MGKYLTTVAHLTYCSACWRPTRKGHALTCPRYNDRADCTAREAKALHAAAKSRNQGDDAC